ncbi:NUMOD4 domain-containing protein [Exiguobacterium sp.]|uniref:NUMOD4 domain-containing protein n=1 Tax=Exiguobacterium sp. TaxID=44751 RepID=UPI0028992F3F|nr:NUMOD4 domain-containing protein [Exiguobacterium sp.]
MFREIPGYEGIYEIDENAIVRTVEGKKTHSTRHGVRVWKQRVLKQKTDRNGYKRVSLYKDKTCRTWLVHRLVAITFIDNPNHFDIINHIDGNPGNNSIENLEWCDSKHNVNHAFNNGLMTSNKKTILKNIYTGEELAFRSQAAADRFLGKYEGCVSATLSKGKNVIANHIVVLSNKE